MDSKFLFAIAVGVACALITLLLRSPLSPIEDQVTAAWVGLGAGRGPDSSIVVVYVDNEAIASLGWPARRNFHALMVRVLTDLHARAIGIEIQFERAGEEYPEYDTLLAGVIGTAGKVVLAGYSSKVVPDGTWSGERDTNSLFIYPGVETPSFIGEGLHLPLSILARNAAGVGHTNLLDNSRVPLFLASDAGVVPSFGAEVVRVAAGASRHAVALFDDRVRIQGRSDVEFVVGRDGAVRVHPPADISEFEAYPFLEVLKAYDALRSGREPGIPVQRFAGKIVLVGVIAEGRSVSVPVPGHPRFPSLFFHASFVGNALQSSFIREPGLAFVLVLSFIIGGGVALALTYRQGVSGKIGAVLLVLPVVLLSYVLFLTSSFLLPVAPVLLAGLVASISSLVYRQRFIHAQVETLRTEKDSIASQLADREAKVALLERELLDFESHRTPDRTSELLEDIRRYKSEIRRLASRAEDMEPYRGPADPGGGVVDFEGIVFESKGKMYDVIAFVEKIAASDAPVMILGESGTGKELIARALHRRSNREGRPLIAVNCGALSSTLLESELFGHEKGAFTGAMKDKPGRFELADGGSIFLDEIGEVDEHFQVKLLRVLQEGELERVGGTRTVKVNVRVIAATNKDLKEQVRLKHFREDLFYRLNVFTVEVPPLRERPEDIPLLVNHFLREEGAHLSLSKNVMEVLSNYGWPGNVRELQSSIKRAALLATSDHRSMISARDLGEDIAAAFEKLVDIEDQVLNMIREKGFSRSSISEIAGELGGLNRGTVAEYLRGQFLKSFVDHGFDVEQTIRHLSLTPDGDVNARVQKRLLEYVTNISGAVDTTIPWEESRLAIVPKTKNLPQRFHVYLEKVAEAFFRGIWKPPSGE